MRSRPEVGADAETEREALARRKTDHTPPVIVLLDPPVTKGIIRRKKDRITVKGIARDTGGIESVIVNNKTAALRGESFSTTLSFSEKDDRIVVIAKDKSGNTAKETFVLLKDERPPPLPPIQKGTHYALLVGIDHYDHWNNLVNPIRDVKAVGDELAKYYEFKTNYLFNPDQEEILLELRRYAGEIEYSENDQLFVMFSGHGKFDEWIKEGYLAAKDSIYNDPTSRSYISYSELRTMLNNIGCKHIFVCLDVCYGGTFDQLIAQSDHKGRDIYGYEDISPAEFIRRKMRFKTRKYLTSGGKEYVGDGRPGSHSPFARRFLEALRNYGGKDRILTLGEILLYMEKATPEPRFGEFGNNEPGSDFLFIAR